MVTDHFKRIQNTDIYKGALMIVFVEANMTWIGADAIAEMLHAEFRHNVFVVEKDPTGNGRLGVVTTDQSLESGVQLMSRSLNRGEHGCITWATPFVSAEPMKQKREFIKEAQQYMQNFRKLGDDVFGMAKMRYSGKGGGKKDDRITSAHQCLHHIEDSLGQSDFRSMLTQRGIPW